uniref:Uncharacterized protein n=1 Tax=Anguilla anguilla TaxID=7936 RepID=A0A0E9W2D7_ANGAN
MPAGQSGIPLRSNTSTAATGLARPELTVQSLQSTAFLPEQLDILQKYSICVWSRDMARGQ